MQALWSRWTPVARAAAAHAPARACCRTPPHVHRPRDAPCLRPHLTPKPHPRHPHLADQHQADVESGGIAGVSGRAQELGGSILTFFRSGYSAVSDGISNAQVPTLESA
jgi:hypothetical protein